MDPAQLLRDIDDILSEEIANKKLKTSEVVKLTAGALSPLRRIRMTVHIRTGYWLIKEGTDKQFILEGELENQQSDKEDWQQVTLHLSKVAGEYWSRYFSKEFFLKLKKKCDQEYSNAPFSKISIEVMSKHITIPILFQRVDIEVTNLNQIQLCFNFSYISSASHLIHNPAGMIFYFLVEIKNKENPIDRLSHLINCCIEKNKNSQDIFYLRGHLSPNRISTPQDSFLILEVSSQKDSIKNGITSEGLKTITINLKKPLPDISFHDFFPLVKNDAAVKAFDSLNSQLTSVRNVRLLCSKLLDETVTLRSTMSSSFTVFGIFVNYLPDMNTVELHDYSGSLEVTIGKDVLNISDCLTNDDLRNKLEKGIAQPESEYIFSVDCKVDFVEMKVSFRLKGIEDNELLINKSLKSWSYIH